MDILCLVFIFALSIDAIQCQNNGSEIVARDGKGLISLTWQSFYNYD